MALAFDTADLGWLSRAQAREVARPAIKRLFDRYPPGVLDPHEFCTAYVLWVHKGGEGSIRSLFSAAIHFRKNGNLRRFTHA